jgi:hypothetical protein
MFPPIGAMIPAFGFFLTFGFELHNKRLDAGQPYLGTGTVKQHCVVTTLLPSLHLYNRFTVLFDSRSLWCSTSFNPLKAKAITLYTCCINANTKSVATKINPLHTFMQWVLKFFLLPVF